MTFVNHIFLILNASFSIIWKSGGMLVMPKIKKKKKKKKKKTYNQLARKDPIL